MSIQIIIIYKNQLTYKLKVNCQNCHNIYSHHSSYKSVLVYKSILNINFLFLLRASV